MRRWPFLLVLAGCVPADQAIGLGSVQFAFTASRLTVEGIPAARTVEGYALRFDRVLLGYHTATIGRVGAPDTCSYRGRGARTDVVIDPRRGVEQTFNGISPVDCPDVGVILGPPNALTTLGDGTTSTDLLALAAHGSHAIVVATATRRGQTFDHADVYELQLEFQPETTGTRFGGCREATKGTTIQANQRDEAKLIFAAENLFRDAISASASLRLAPFIQADLVGDGDHVVTMAELDRLQLDTIFDGNTYEQVDGSNDGSFGDYVRTLFRFTIAFRSEDGICIGNAPGL